MLHIKRLEDGLELFKALGSDVRVQIIRLLLEEKELNMNELASRLDISNGALTAHIKKLESSGLIGFMAESAGHGNQKRCVVRLDKILIELGHTEDPGKVCETEIHIGHYSDYSIYPTCGLADTEKLIGSVDDARYFAHPDRVNAAILWFTKGYVEYVIPNFVPYMNQIDQITLSAELSSEAPGVNSSWPSDIYFSLNGTRLGHWTSPGDFGDVKGLFTPGWWLPNWNQYGLLKMIVINHDGTYVDGLKISDVSIDSLKLDSRSILKFRFEVPEDAEHAGGLTLFGKGFGNYNQDIRVRLQYSPLPFPLEGSASISAGQ